MRDVSRLVFIVAIAVALNFNAGAQAPNADPDALKAFEKLVQAYRSHPALKVSTSVKLTLEQGDTEANGSEIEGEFLFGPDQTAVVKLRGFTCYLSNGSLTAIHEDTDDAYFKMGDDDSPYYALMNVFLDIPFPELALALGEDDVEDVLMQFHQKAPWVQPVSVANEDFEGKTYRHLQLSSDHADISIRISPESGLIDTVIVNITGGEIVQQGAQLTYQYQYEHEIINEPVENSEFSLDPGDRRIVDVMSALMPKPDVQEGGPGGLVGNQAPGFVLATIAGNAVDLAALEGHVVVLDFWATWCGPCRVALPLLHEVSDWASDELLPVTILTINTMERMENPDDRLDAVKRFWDGKKFTLPVAMDYTNEVAQSYGVRGIPATFVIRSDGIVHAQHAGVGGDYVDQLKNEIRDAMDAVEHGDDHHHHH